MVSDYPQNSLFFPNISINPNYPFSVPRPSVTDKSKQNHAYHFHGSCTCFFIHVGFFCLIFLVLLSSFSHWWRFFCWWGSWCLLVLPVCTRSSLCQCVGGQPAQAGCVGRSFDTLSLWCSFLYGLTKMPGPCQCTLLCFLLIRLWLVTWHKANEDESEPVSKCVPL